MKYTPVIMTMTMQCAACCDMFDFEKQPTPRSAPGAWVVAKCAGCGVRIRVFVPITECEIIQ